jgi:hypothetical protein
MVGCKTSRKLSDILVFIQGFLCITFLLAVGVCTSGLGLSSDGQCYAAIRVCIAMYGTAKMALYVCVV